MLTVYRRHRKGCKQREEGRTYLRCLCPIWVDGLLNGIEIRKSLKTRDWQAANDRVRRWETEGKKDERPAPILVKDACDKFIADAEARGLREPTLYKYRLLFRQLQNFASIYGLRTMANFDVDWVRRFCASWPNKNIAARKKLEALRAFFRFVHESGWIPTNPSSRLKSPRITDPPTAPLLKEEVDSILKACATYPDKANAVRLQALILLLRYSGLRIREAVTLPRNRVQGDKIFLFTAKTGTAVYCPLPPIVIKALNEIPESTHYFWTGLSKPKSAVGDWQHSLKRLFTLAGVPDAHAHRFRDTFSVELLLAGVPIERVSILLGHQSVRITEKHYAPWVRAGQEQLEADVRRTWPEEKPPEEVQPGYTREPKEIISLDSVRKNGGGGGSRAIPAHTTHPFIRQQRGKKGGVKTTLKTDAAFRDIDLHFDLAKMLSNYIGDRKEGFLLPTRSGNMLSPEGFFRGGLATIFKRMGRTRVRFNAFRRFRESVLLRSECRQILIDYWMGHENPDMSARYGRQLTEDVKYRKEWAQKVGLGFNLPRAEPPSDVVCATCATNFVEHARAANA